VRKVKRGHAGGVSARSSRRTYKRGCGLRTGRSNRKKKRNKDMQKTGLTKTVAGILTPQSAGKAAKINNDFKGKGL